MSVWDNVSAGLGVLLQVGELVTMIACVVWFAKRLTALDAEMRERAIRETRIEKLDGIGYATTYADRVGLLRWRGVVAIERYQTAPPQPETIVHSLNGKPTHITIKDDPARRHAVEVLLQTRRHPNYGEHSDRLIPAHKFDGATETWESGTRFLESHYGAFKVLGVGSFCGADHPTPTALLRAVTSPPLQHNGNGAS